jgi:hypothetical protein
MQRFPIYERALLFGRFLGFTRWPFWQKQYVVEDERAALVAY